MSPKKCLWAAAALTVVLLPLLGGIGRTAVAARQLTFRNPVYKHDFPDPFVLKVGKTYYAYATTDGLHNVQEMHSRDLVHWSGSRDAMPLTARWVASDVWAPEVLHVGRTYVLYYTAKSQQLQTHCLGRAVATSPTGPFRDSSRKPFLCQPSLGGDIDPSPFRDRSGKLYLLWKSDGISIDVTDYIFAQRLTGDGLRLTGKPAKLVSNRQPWEGAQVEGPTMWQQAGKYYLFFSGNMYNSYSYAVGYATCKGPMGPCQQAAENPILHSGCKAAGPGGQTITTDAKGQTWILYHAWPSDAVGDNSAGRQLWLDRLIWKNGKPKVHGPTCGAQTEAAV